MRYVSARNSSLLNTCLHPLGRMKLGVVCSKIDYLYSSFPKSCSMHYAKAKLNIPKPVRSRKSKTTINITLLLDEATRENLSLTQINERVKEYNAVPEQPPSLKVRYQQISSKLQKAKVWDNPKKQKGLEKLLVQLEKMLESEEV